MVVGVAGKYCAGKSTVAGVLADGGYRVIDVDSLGHEALTRRIADVRRTFGDEYIDSDGVVDRRKLGGLVFRDSGAMRDLERIVHPEMVQMVREQLAEAADDRVVVSAALLFPMGLDALCDLALWVRAPLLTRLLRASRRDRLPVVEILRRFRAQRALRPQPSRSDVDIHTVENRGDLERLRGRLIELSLLEE
ncbi:MAG: dephospho-CoA kinase [Spirochaetota bacterium]